MNSIIENMIEMFAAYPLKIAFKSIPPLKGTVQQFGKCLFVDLPSLCMRRSISISISVGPV